MGTTKVFANTVLLLQAQIQDAPRHHRAHPFDDVHTVHTVRCLPATNTCRTV